jgi:hypothetical protein
MMMTTPSSPPSSRPKPGFRPAVLVRRLVPETGVDAGSDEHRLQVFVCDVRVGVGSVVVRMRVVVVIVVRMGLGFVRGPHTADRDGLVLESMLVTRDRNEMLVILGSSDDHLPNRSPRSLPLPIPVHLLVHPLQPPFIHLLLLSPRDQPVTRRILPSRALAVHPDFAMGAFVEPGLRIRGETEEGVEVDVAGCEEGKGGRRGGEGCVDRCAIKDVRSWIALKEARVTPTYPRWLAKW